MGTRSLTYVYDDENTPVVCMYRQYDGYPSGHGAELAEFLGSFEAITNGISGGEERKTANGMCCLAAQLVAEFKTEVGGVYLMPCKVKQDCGQDYEYHVFDGDRVVIKDYNYKVLFDGSCKEFTTFCESAED
jgi:hypothetical protein